MKYPIGFPLASVFARFGATLSDTRQLFFRPGGKSIYRHQHGYSRLGDRGRNICQS